MFGFLLALPFTTRSAEIDAWQRDLYVTDPLLAAFATALLIAPVAYHRIVLRRHAKRRLLFRANALAITGLCVMAIAISGSVLLVTSAIYASARRRDHRGRMCTHHLRTLAARTELGCGAGRVLMSAAYRRVLDRETTCQSMGHCV